MPKAIAMGITYNEFWEMNPHIINIYLDAEEEKKKQKDAEMHMMGLYIIQSITCTLGNTWLFKEKGDELNKYPTEPFLSQNSEYTGLTQEEIDNREIQKMILAEEQWRQASLQKGLPDTDIA